MSWELSTEELALAVSIAGDARGANALLQSTFGPMSEDERKGRLMAAGASLAARHLLQVEEGKETSLAPTLAKVTNILIHPAFTLRYDKAKPSILDSLAYHFGHKDDLVIEHRVSQGVVHQLSEVDRERVLGQGSELFAVPPKAAGQVPDTTIARAVFDDARNRAALQPTTAQALLEGAGLSAKYAKALTEDLRRNKYQGSVMRIEYDAEGRPSSDRGFLMMQSERRTWILPILVKGEDAFISPRLAGIEEFRQATQELMN